MTVLESTLSVENRYRQLFRQRLVILAVIFIAIIASLLLDFTLGPSGLPLHSLIKTLMHPSGATNGMRVIVWDIRLPYALMALLVGITPSPARLRLAFRRRRPLAQRWRLFWASVFPAFPKAGLYRQTLFFLRSCPPCCSIV